MKIVNVLIIVLLVLIPVVCFSEVIVSYIQGECVIDINGDGNWKAPSINENLNEKSIIKTDKGGEIELKIDGDNVVIGENTIVIVNYIVDNLKHRKKIGWFSGFSSMLAKITKGAEQTGSAFLGVRGKPEDEEGIEWMEESEEEAQKIKFDEGKLLYQEGRYGEAINIFKDLIERKELSSMRGEISFYLGSSLFNNVQYRDAILYLEESIKDKHAYYYEAALIKYSFAQYFSSDYQRAINGFKAYTEEFEVGEMRPYALFMIGKSYKAMGNSKDAKRYFSEIANRYMESEVYPDALQELKDIR